MNDNVKKIPMLEKFAAQSLVYVDTGLDDGKELVFSKEKFAELIVAECMRMCDVAAIGYESHNHHFKEANGCYSAKEYIEEHFGVE